MNSFIKRMQSLLCSLPFIGACTTTAAPEPPDCVYGPPPEDRAITDQPAPDPHETREKLVYGPPPADLSADASSDALPDNKWHDGQTN